MLLVEISLFGVECVIGHFCWFVCAWVRLGWVCLLLVRIGYVLDLLSLFTLVCRVWMKSQRCFCWISWHSY